MPAARRQRDDDEDARAAAGDIRPATHVTIVMMTRLKKRLNTDPKPVNQLFFQKKRTTLQCRHPLQVVLPAAAGDSDAAALGIAPLLTLAGLLALEVC